MVQLPPDVIVNEFEEPSGAGPTLDSRAFRDALGTFATGITVVTVASHRGPPVGVTANSFSSVSLDPPLVLFSLGRTALSARAFLSASHFAVNVLSSSQAALSDRFARVADDWRDVSCETWETGCPILAGSAASFECAVRYTHDGGDHVIFVGEVRHMRFDREARPLLYWRGRYCALAG